MVNNFKLEFGMRLSYIASKRKTMIRKITILLPSFFCILLCSCDQPKSSEERNGNLSTTNNSGFHLKRTDPKIKAYWYNGQAEICSYELTQARYGELRKGEAVTVFVAEPFSKISMTKADRRDDQTVSVMKLNFQKRFNTGIYPYNLMTSSFFPIQDGNNSIKVSHSMQEWCGHVFMEWINNERPSLEVKSYFQGENQAYLPKTDVLEDDYWTKIRLNPNKIKLGKRVVFPSFAYLRFSHVEPKGYACEVSQTNGNKTSALSLNYPELNRTLNIEYESEFPYTILGWTETYTSGWGNQAKQLTSSGKLNKKMMSAYWQQHDNVHEVLRDSLGLQL